MSERKVQKTLKYPTKHEKDDSELDAWIEDVIQKFMGEEGMTEDTTSTENTTKQPEEDGEGLLFFKTPKAGNNERNCATMNISIKAITLIEKDKVPIKVEDSPDNKDQSTEEDRDIEPQEERSTVTLRPKESRKIPVLKPNMLKKTTSKQNQEDTEKRVKARAKAEGFRYMYFRNIPTTVEDFREKDKTWEGFEKALKVIGLESKEVLARLQKELPAYENMKTQNILCQQAYLEYSSDPKADIDDGPEPRTIKLKDNKRVVLKGRSDTQRKDTPKGNRATSSKPAKELEELIKALKNKEYRTQKEKTSWEDRVEYLQNVEARRAVKIKGTVGREIKRNLPTPCPSCSG
jgi:hypothetical protein